MIFDLLSRTAGESAQAVLITNREGTIQYVNAAFEAMTGFTRDDLIGRRPNVLRSGLHKPRFYERLWATILAGHTFHAIITDRRRDGRLFEYEQTITPIRNTEGVITHFMSSGRDVSDARRVDGGLLLSQLEHEGRRVAELLHADTGQYLALAHMTLVDVARDVDARIGERLQEVRQYLDHIEERLRTATRSNESPILSELGLVDALKFLADRWMRSGSVEVTVESSFPSACPAAVETLVYQVAQEAIGALVRETASRKVTIALTREVPGPGARDEVVSCTIRGDGTNTPPVDSLSPPQRFVGLDAMRTRVTAAGGTLDIVTVPGSSTTLRAVVPLQA